MKRALVTLAACLAVCAAVTPVATADPINAKNATQISATCGGKPVMVVVNGNGEFTAAHVVGDTSVFIPTAFNITFSFTAGGTTMTETDTSAKAAPVKNTITCTIPLQTIFSGPEGTATIKGTVTGFFTPRG